MNYVLELTKQESEKIIQFYRDYTTTTNNPHALFYAKTKDLSVTVYTSFKVMFQGKTAESEYQMWCDMLGHKVTSSLPKESSDYYTVSIGSDEVGTGDFFGPMVVCAAYVSNDAIDYIKTLHIDDSKKITDDKIRILGEQLTKKVPYSMVALHNEKFNELNQKGYNMNKLKAMLHNTAIVNLLDKIQVQPMVIVDQFAEASLYYRYLQSEPQVYRNITFTTKAESKYASVAIGSIIARYAFLQYFDELIHSSGYPLLKGASSKVDELTATIIKEKGEAYLRKIAKCNFITIQKAKDLL